MILKKTIIVIFCLSFLNSCAQNTAFLAPVYTYGSSGNMYQAGLSYASNQAITNVTGMSPAENVKSLLSPNKKGSNFTKLVKRRVELARKKLNLPNQ